MEKNIQLNNASKADHVPYFSITGGIMSSIEESLKKGEKIEFVSFTQWQKKHSLNIKANKKEFYPLGRYDDK